MAGLLCTHCVPGATQPLPQASPGHNQDRTWPSLLAPSHRCANGGLCPWASSTLMPSPPGTTAPTLTGCPGWTGVHSRFSPQRLPEAKSPSVRTVHPPRGRAQCPQPGSALRQTGLWRLKCPARRLCCTHRLTGFTREHQQATRGELLGARPCAKSFTHAMHGSSKLCVCVVGGTVAPFYRWGN